MPIFFDRTRAATDETCERARYYSFEYDKKGVVSGAPSYHLAFGLAVHDSLEDLANGKGLSAALDADRAEELRRVTALTRGRLLPPLEVERVCNESLSLWEGLVRGADLHLFPLLRREFDIEAVELEASADLGSGVVLGARPDLILRRKSDGTLWYFEYKTTSNLRPQWFESWEYAVQLAAGAVVVASKLGEKLEGCIVQGLNKGFEKKGRQESIFTYAYVPRSHVPGDDAALYEYRPGCIKNPVWSLPGGVERWVRNMPSHVLASQYPCTEPLPIQHAQVDSWIRQRVTRELEIREARERLTGDLQHDTPILDKHFRQNFNACCPSFGMGCGFRKLCYNPDAAADPYSVGYTVREPHHTTELEVEDA